MDTGKLCFVIGPIGETGSPERKHSEWVLEGIIRPVFSEHFPDYYVENAAQITTPGSINTQVISRLLEAPLVIADLSTHNANAFYELAIRHSPPLPTIHLIREDEKIPFDVAPLRAIRFSYDTPALIQQAKVALRAFPVGIESEGFPTAVA